MSAPEALMARAKALELYGLLTGRRSRQAIGWPP
jgi:hypothetical protein